tara:strand:+ start:722 stop:1219 length:498 start_codon:yes stop_codon:yes gene_type:complete
MAMSLRTYLNNKIKEKGSSLSKEKAKASKYKSIAAAKKAGALYYTNKDGKVMAAVYAEDLKKAKPKLGVGKRPKVEVRTLSNIRGGRGDNKNEVLIRRAEIAISAGTEPKKSSSIRPKARPTKTALRAKIRKLNTQIANARQKGKDNKTAVAEVKRLTSLLRKLK